MCQRWEEDTLFTRLLVYVHGFGIAGPSRTRLSEHSVWLTAYIHIRVEKEGGGGGVSFAKIPVLLLSQISGFFSYRLCSELWWIVVDVSDSDDSSGCVGEAVHGVALHVSGLDDQCVLGDFLLMKKEKKTSNKNYTLFIVKPPQYTTSKHQLL